MKLIFCYNISMIRKAMINDIENIWKLHEDFRLDVSMVNDNDYLAKSQGNGFIVSDSTKEEIKKRIEGSLLFNVWEEDGKIVGLIDVNKEIYFPEEADNIIWLDKDLKSEYFHGNEGITLHYVAVDENYRGKGIATSLYKNSLETLKGKGYKHLFSIVTIAPVTNCPSIIWHTKMDFKRACVTMPIDLFGLKDYMSLLFYRPIL
ncbi:hypothetical protein COT49_03120 [candidate division WWE3 bacterium CG08_land_8_20_14_0_20_40_13]|uniref:N-acetyltransferase domain-containing protein n=1 Tax=candidate division WWE3 bacterium CG08_land_8_20_14_0_20_40_13 TaxID=1975084 RepID=A0A2H0XDD7_UNCKA|nr:MAG: hypothetical protein COT49_03120 [candidate division WWE3 bacterium CG08_land_8_20_14_0_20_40_13]